MATARFSLRMLSRTGLSSVVDTCDHFLKFLSGVASKSGYATMKSPFFYLSVFMERKSRNVQNHPSLFVVSGHGHGASEAGGQAQGTGRQDAGQNPERSAGAKRSEPPAGGPSAYLARSVRGQNRGQTLHHDGEQGTV
ncbi:MAG TPA: hypothetical protein VLT16_03770 [Candidatus Limnocylindrales bacterium]|nr:hypothetical protein [Candidatus Limnocylindrales bacterium]